MPAMRQTWYLKISPERVLYFILVHPVAYFRLFILYQQRMFVHFNSTQATGSSTIRFHNCYVEVKEKVKVTLVQALRLCTGRTAHRGSRGIALPFIDQGTRKGWGVSVTPRPLFTPGKDPVPIVQEAGWAPGPVWTGAENLAPTGIRSSERPARSQSLYRLSYPAHSTLRY